MKLPHYLLILCGLLTSFLTNAMAETLDYIVAVVNEEVIVRTALDHEIRLAESRLKEQSIRLPPRTELERQVLDNMIVTTLQLQLASRTGITIDDNSLNDTLRGIAAQNQMDLQAFKQTVEKDSYSFVHFRQDVRNEMTIRQLQQRHVVSRISVSEREIDNFLANQAQQGTINHEYHLLHILIATPEAASPEEIETKRQKAQEVLEKLKAGADFQEMAVTVSNSAKALTGGDLGWLKLGQVPSLLVETVNTLAVGDISEPIRDASGFHIVKLADKRSIDKNIVTQTKVRHILIKTSESMSDSDAKSRLDMLKARIKAGDDFVVLARANSEDPNSAANGGSLDWVSPGDLAPEVEQVINRLADKEISEPFKSRFGWHIFQVLDHRTYDNTDKALRAKAMQQIRQRKTEEELQSWVRQLRDEAYVEYRLDNRDS